MGRYIGDKRRTYTQPRSSNVRGEPCPGMYVEDPRETLVRNVNKLAEKMKKEGLSQSEFCRRANLHYETWMRLRRGLTWPDPGTLRKIASTAGIPVEVLFRR